jgi:hypothetical protein
MTRRSSAAGQRRGQRPGQRRAHVPAASSGLHPTAHVPRPMPHRRCPTGDAPQAMPHRRSPTGDLPQAISHRRSPTGDLPQRPRRPGVHRPRLPRPVTPAGPPSLNMTEGARHDRAPSGGRSGPAIDMAGPAVPVALVRTIGRSNGAATRYRRCGSTRSSPGSGDRCALAAAAAFSSATGSGKGSASHVASTRPLRLFFGSSPLAM